jgi:hypothetical protein
MIMHGVTGTQCQLGVMNFVRLLRSRSLFLTMGKHLHPPMFLVGVHNVPSAQEGIHATPLLQHLRFFFVSGFCTRKFFCLPSNARHRRSDPFGIS